MGMSHGVIFAQVSSLLKPCTPDVSTVSNIKEDDLVLFSSQIILLSKEVLGHIWSKIESNPELRYLALLSLSTASYVGGNNLYSLPSFIKLSTIFPNWAFVV